MSTSSRIISLKSRLAIYRMGLHKAENHGNAAEIGRWEDSIAALEQEIDELDNDN